MIVFDLRCAGGHVFEAWFGSTGDYEAQRERGLVSCPMCGEAKVDKAPMAPAVAAKGNRGGGGAAVALAGGDDDARRKAVLAEMATLQRRMLEGSEWVGGSFAGEARAMHDGEKPHRPIHGQATLAEAKALVDDGVPVAPLPLPVVPPEASN